ncbi:MAG: Hsp20/alpha crystallin family protein [Nitrosotalea sp.]
MSDFASIIEKQMNAFFGNTLFDDFIHKELVPLSHLKERHTSWTLEVDLPLVDKKNVEVTLSDDHLTVKAKLTKTYCISKGNTVTEFDYFKKTVKLPSGINTKQISANFKNGILKITMPKPSDGKKISIK